MGSVEMNPFVVNKLPAPSPRQSHRVMFVHHPILARLNTAGAVVQTNGDSFLCDVRSVPRDFDRIDEARSIIHLGPGPRDNGSRTASITSRE